MRILQKEIKVNGHESYYIKGTAYRCGVTVASPILAVVAAKNIGNYGGMWSN